MLPAYGKAISEKLAAGIGPGGFLFVCCTFKLAKQAMALGQWAVVVADDKPLEAIDLRCCTALPCFVCGPNLQRLSAVADAVAAAKPTEVWQCVAE
jgi:hypothetical protein